MSYDVLKAMTMNTRIIVFWGSPREEVLLPEDESRKFLRNVGKYLPDYTMSHPTRQ
jgi:hypothetical protein